MWLQLYLPRPARSCRIGNGKGPKSRRKRGGRYLFSRRPGFASLQRRNPEQIQGVKPIIGRSGVNQGVRCTTGENGQLTLTVSAARLFYRRPTGTLILG